MVLSGNDAGCRPYLRALHGSCSKLNAVCQCCLSFHLVGRMHAVPRILKR